MNRWNIATIFFLSVSGQRREITFRPDEVNIITGASGTGKSTVIKAIDYCLGSKNCELPAHVKRRCVAVGVKWVRGEQELIVGRIIPPVGQGTSTHMYCSTGRNLVLPTMVEDFEGPVTVSSGKRIIENALGIDDIDGLPNDVGEVKGRATVRHVTPYLFVTKEVIYSESILLHGLEDAEKARDIIGSMPYFLGVVNQTTAIEIQKLRNLERALEREEARELARSRAETSRKQRALSLLAEANRLGLAVEPDMGASEASLIADLRRLADSGLPALEIRQDGELTLLSDRRQAVLGRLTELRRQSRAAKIAIRDASGAGNAVARQRERLQLAEHLGIDSIGTLCPVCSSPSEIGKQSAAALRSTLEVIRSEVSAIERVRPGFVEYDRTIDAQIAELNVELRAIDSQMSGVIRANESTRTLATAAEAHAHILGRISFFLETVDAESTVIPSSLDGLRDAIEELRSRVGKDDRDVRMRIAERDVSGYASEAFSELPTVAPCIGSKLYFNSRKPEVSIIEEGSRALLKMSDVGSDQNYLAVHIALMFGLQRHFELVNAPVPGILIFDQISRPYFPAKSENEERDEREIVGGNEDDDIAAMRKHVDFLFRETARRSGLQVLLIEHAYFADDPRYVSATRERWTKASGKALIPLDWQVRPDHASAGGT